MNEYERIVYVYEKTKLFSAVLGDLHEIEIAKEIKKQNPLARLI